MKKHRRKLIALAVLPIAAGCAVVLPHTSEAIAPANWEDVWLSFMADIQQWLILLGL